MINRTVLIIESEESSLTVLELYLNRLPFFDKPIVCRTTGEALYCLSQRPYDLIIVNMQLADSNGIEIIKCLPTHPPMIATSVDANDAASCFDLDVSDYIVKPIAFQRFVRAVNRALKVQYLPNILVENQAIYLKTGRSIQRFYYNQIDYIEAFGMYSKIWQQQKVTIVNEPISALEISLPPQRFMRIHKSYIVSLESFDSYNHSTINVGGAKIPLGASHRPKFEGFLNLLSTTAKNE